MRGSTVRIPVLLSGGIGSRLWPLSRQNYPKQFLPLIGENSLFQSTLFRLYGMEGIVQTMVVAQQAHRFLVAEQLRKVDFLDTSTLILEPFGKGTAPAVALAAFYAVSEGLGDAELLILPADHAIEDTEGFQRSMDKASELASQGYLVTFGVAPARPDTGFGYIEVDTPLSETGYKVKAFTEKPDFETAQRYIADQKHWWNSGMFLFKASAYLSVLKDLAPDIYAACEQSIAGGHDGLDYLAPDEKAYGQCPSDSIDYAVMEKCKTVAMVELESPWCDVGSWSSLANQFEADDSGNVSQGNVFLHDCNNAYVRSESRLVTAVGVDNLVVIETPDALLVMDKAKDQDIKYLIAKMKRKEVPELTFHRKVHRPWGAFEGLDRGDRYQVKRITVSPGSQLSLQMHHHRSEHWVVVKGSAKVTRGEETFLLTENQSTYIPIGVHHRLENVGKIELEIVEVQSGSYLGEDDIIRLEDTYGRLDKKTPVTS